MSPIVNLQLVVKCKKRSFHSFKVDVSLLRYIVFYCELGCDTSELHVSYISRACSSLVRQPYYIPNRFLLKISRLETILATKKGRWDGRSFYMDEYTLIFLFSRCIRCAQKRDCWEAKQSTQLEIQRLAAMLPEYEVVMQMEGGDHPNNWRGVK